MALTTTQSSLTKLLKKLGRDQNLGKKRRSPQCLILAARTTRLRGAQQAHN